MGDALRVTILTVCRQRYLRLRRLPRGYQAPCERRASLHGYVSSFPSLSSIFD